MSMLPSIMSKPKDKDKDRDKEKDKEKEAKKVEKERKAKKDGKKGKKGSRPNGINIWGAERIDATNSSLIDDFIRRCLNWLRHHKSQEKEGIFRKSGSEKRLIELSADVGDGDYMLTEEEDDHVVGTLLKRFFRDMKGPLVTFDLYDTFIGADAFDGEERVQNVLQALKLLPEHHLRVLETLMRYLHEVAQFSAQNFMTASNLAIVFAPNLIRPKIETPLTLISDASHVTALIASLIADCDIYFPKVSAAPTSAPSIAAPHSSHSNSNQMNKEDFKKTMNIKYVAHQTLSLSLVAQMAKEAHLSDEEMQHKLKVIGSRIKKGDKKAVGLLFSDEGEHEGSQNTSGKSPLRSHDVSPLESPRRTTVDSAEDHSANNTNNINNSSSSNKRATTSDLVTPSLSESRKNSKARGIPKSLDLFGGTSPQPDGLSASTPIISTSPSPAPHATMAKSPSNPGLPPLPSSSSTSTSTLIPSTSSSSLNASTLNSSTSSPLSPHGHNNGPISSRNNSRPNRTREHRREGHADLSKFLKEILHNNEIVEAAAAAETKESETEKAALAETLATRSDDDEDEGDSA